MTRVSRHAAIAVTAALTVALAATPLGSQGGAAGPRLVAYSGPVDVVRKGETLRPYPNLPLAEGDVVHARAGALAAVRFADKTELRLRENTRVAISEDARHRDIDVFFGRIWSFIAARKDQATSFRSTGTIAAVRGTEVEIWVREDGTPAAYGVNEGRLVLRSTLPDGSERTIEIPAGSAVTIAPDGTPGPLQPHLPGQIASLPGGRSESLDDEAAIRLTQVNALAGNNPFDPANPAAPVAGIPATPSPRPTSSPGPGGSPTPAPTPSVPGPCSDIAFASCADNAGCCRPLLCFQGQCCRQVTERCQAGANEGCCPPAACAFNQALGRDTCCFGQGDRCGADRECCSGSCTRGRCSLPTPTPSPCLPFYATCAADLDCCTERCVNLPSPSAFCLCSFPSDMRPCRINANCCSNSCSGGVCACFPQGAPCTGDPRLTECCVGRCTGGICTCAPPGAPCTVGAIVSECCSGMCPAGTCL